MTNRVFLFDLDATITREEILPNLAEQVGMLKEMREMTEKTMRGEIPFQSSFLARVEMLKTIPVSRVAEIVEKTPLNEELVQFIRTHASRCYIVTGNIDVWIEKLIKRIGLPMSHCYCSSASVSDDYIISVNSVVDKEKIAKQFVVPIVAVGDGSNDAEMVRLADVGIGYGGVRPVAYSLMCNATHVICDEHRLCNFLHTLCADEGETI